MVWCFFEGGICGGKDRENLLKDECYGKLDFRLIWSYCSGFTFELQSKNATHLTLPI